MLDGLLRHSFRCGLARVPWGPHFPGGTSTLSFRIKFKKSLIIKKL